MSRDGFSDEVIVEKETSLVSYPELFSFCRE